MSVKLHSFFAKQHQVRVMSSAYLLMVDNWEMNLDDLLDKKTQLNTLLTGFRWWFICSMLLHVV